jgi:hypothetical protein
MDAISVWTATAQERINDESPVVEKRFLNFVFSVFNTGDSLWIVAQWPAGGRVAFRAAFAANDDFTVTGIVEKDNSLLLNLQDSAAEYEVNLQFPDQNNPILRYTTCLKPQIPLFIPFWPRDILPLTKEGKIQNTTGIIHADQVGTRSGLLFMSVTRPDTGSVFYFQNLTALNDYCEDTKTSAGGLVGGKWPEIGFTLPVTKDDPLLAGKTYVISDAFVHFTEEIPSGNIEMSKQYLNTLGLIYPLLPRPDVEYHDWLTTVERGLSDLSHHKGCWTFAGGHPYLNAYVSDYQTPPEIMVQLAVLLPLVEYQLWKEQVFDVFHDLKAGFTAFYDDQLKTISRWLPAKEHELDKSEEQKEEKVMDSWYLHHPMLNLARLAQLKHKNAETLLLDSIDYVIKVAKHFKYQWPVFYKMDTLEVKKAETEPGQGGEKDVPGAYAHLMLETWQVTGDKRFFNEAVKAVKSLEGLGFDLFYQANNTAFAAGALLKLYKETRDEKYLDLSYVCIASLIKNVQLWDCNYGYAKNYPTFFAIFPLKDAPYTAAYEEAEVYAAVSYYLQEAQDIEILPAVSLLLAEFSRYFISRAPYYYPPMLPKEVLAEEVKTGEIDPNAWISLEDLKDGWEKSGEVGQEVYGAGVAFGIVPRQYIKVPGEDFIIFTDYPVNKTRITKNKSLTFHVLGSPSLTCALCIIPEKKVDKRNFTLSVAAKGKQWQELKPANRVKKYSYKVPGSVKVKIEW